MELSTVNHFCLRSGNVLSQYSYTPFGERTKIAGSGQDADFGFAGMYAPARSGLNLTLFRAYDPSLARWLSRDPIGEAAGTNLYAYVGNSPVNSVDPFGLDGIYYQNANQLHPLLAGSLTSSRAVADVFDWGGGNALSQQLTGQSLVTRQGVDATTSMYTTAPISSLLVGALRTMYSAAAAHLSMLNGVNPNSATWEQAIKISQQRDWLKSIFRGPLFPNAGRMPLDIKLTKYATPEDLIRAAQRTNPGFNLAGLWALLSGARAQNNSKDCPSGNK